MQVKQVPDISFPCYYAITLICASNLNFPQASFTWQTSQDIGMISPYFAQILSCLCHRFSNFNWFVNWLETFPFMEWDCCLPSFLLWCDRGCRKRQPNFQSSFAYTQVLRSEKSLAFMTHKKLNEQKMWIYISGKVINPGPMLKSFSSYL